LLNVHQTARVVMRESGSVWHHGSVTCYNLDLLSVWLSKILAIA
jgi:hypothetical protein